MTESHIQEVRWDLTYDIHLGATWSRFMDGLRDRRITATSCDECNRTFVPPQAYCESCFIPLTVWQELEATGSLEVYTVVWHGFDGGPQPPYVIGGIRLDGASTLIMHRLAGVDLSDPDSLGDLLPLGTRVRAVWAEERSGQILDIAHFEVCSPAEGHTTSASQS